MPDNNYGITKRLFLVSLGSVPGALLRWFISNDLLANVLGVLILGFILGANFSHRYKLIIAIGFCGSCTTFSSWMVNVLELILEGNIFQAILSLASTILLGILFFSLAFSIGRKTKRSRVPQ